MNDLDLIKKYSGKVKYSNIEKADIKRLCTKYGVPIQTCKCPNKWNDMVLSLYALLTKTKKPLTENDEFEYIGVGENYDSEYGLLNKNTPKSIIKAMYKSSYNTFKSFFRIKKR